jgi:hypothetical protein
MPDAIAKERKLRATNIIVSARMRWRASWTADSMALFLRPVIS